MLLFYRPTAVESVLNELRQRMLAVLRHDRMLARKNRELIQWNMYARAR